MTSIHISRILNVFIMSGILSLVLTIVNRGVTEIQLFLWLKNWGIAFVFATLLSFSLLPWTQNKILEFLNKK